MKIGRQEAKGKRHEELPEGRSWRRKRLEAALEAVRDGHSGGVGKRVVV